MGIFSRLEKRSSLAEPERWLLDWFSGGHIETSAGVRVTTASAMYFTAVYACIDILSRTIGSLPLYLYQRLPGGGKEKARKHPLFNRTRYQPNPEMTAMRYRSTLQGHLASWGNCYSYIDWGGDGYPRALWPIRPDRVQIMRIGGELIYRYFPGLEDMKLQEGFIIPPANMLHIPGFGYDGLIGYSPITLAREAIGLGLATEEFGARFFGSGTHPGMIIEHPKALGKTGYDNLKQALSDAYSGLGQSHRMMLLEEGMTAKPITINPTDSQFIETRKLQIAEIARIFHVPPHMIADLERSTNNNIEHQGIEFVVHTMRPWLVLWEEEMNRVLLRSDEKDEYFFMFDADALLRGDTPTRFAAYATAKSNGWMNADEIRDKENMNPMPGGQGQMYLVPLNMIPADQAGKGPANKVPPAATV
jgi:HK97 family phage portal protein